MADRLPEQQEAYRLTVPVDASGVEEREEGQPLKVAAIDVAENVSSDTIKLDVDGRGSITFTFDQQPGRLRVVVGPEDASDDELAGMQTLSADVPAILWRERRELEINPLIVTPYFWHWWRRWCRTFTIRGRVLCPDGHPVIGAKVCAFDVDWFWWWHSQQQVGCATTALDGSFEIAFRWCCGWWPWWWWRHRWWSLDPLIAAEILPVLQREQILKLPLRPDPEPDLAIFSQFLGTDIDRMTRASGGVGPAGDPSAGVARAERLVAQLRGEVTRPADAKFDLNQLERLGEVLRQRLPVVPRLERLQLWPWWRWYPWWDCTPDIIFRVTQACDGQDQVIVDEQYFDTRWNIPTSLDVTLVANENACCLPPEHPCEAGQCLAFTLVCDDLITSIGGNLGAPLIPEGFKNPGLVSTAGDRPYAGNIPISGTVPCMGNVDYYEFEWSSDGGATWNAMPPAAAGGFTRTYYDFPTTTFGSVFVAPQPIDGRFVFETLQRYEATHPLPAGESWGGTRHWVGASRDYLMNWLTENSFSDGTYRLRVLAWELVGPDDLDNPLVLRQCETDAENWIVITLDNRLVGPASGHPLSTPSHPAGPGTVHTLTLEPDTDFLDVRIVRPDGTEYEVLPCDIREIGDDDLLQVDFMAHDPDGHLSFYTLHATFGENGDVDLLALSPSLTSSPASAPVPPAAHVGPRYDDALAQGATLPIWHGGAIRLQMKAKSVFTESCCYQLELRAHKRTIVNCDESLWGHTNYSEYSFMIVI
jgi:hypothetical protein